MSVWSTHAKRKEPEETVVELLRNVSLSPPKRVRIANSWTPTNSWPTPSFESQAGVQLLPPQADPLLYEQSPSPPSPVATASRPEEKAIILYKGVDPPLFPGGPPTGSPEPPFILDTSGALAACKGTGNNGSTVVDAGHASSALNNSSSDAHIWTGLFEALDLHGNKPFLPTRRLQRTSSCSSLPQVSTSMDDSSMDESDALPSTSTSQLALISYAPPSFPLAAVSSVPATDSSQEMADDGDAMDVMEESTPAVAADGVATESGTQFGSPIPTFGSTTQWEPCDMFKAPYSSEVMWSH